jgi:hypothetical protein
MPSSLVVLADPEEIFRDIRDRSRWITPLGYCALVFFLIIWLGGCWTDIREGLRWSSLLVPAVAAIVIVCVLGAASTLLLYVGHRVINGGRSGEPRYRTLFSLNMHCAIILVLGELVNFLLVHTGIPPPGNLPLANRFPLGLDLLLLGAKEPNIYMTILLHSTSAFTVWYLVILARGLRDVAHLSTAQAAAVALTLWLVGVGAILSVVYSAGGGTVFRVVV